MCLKDLTMKGVKLSTATEEELTAYSSVISSSLQTLQIQVATIFCGYQPLTIEFASHCYPAKKIVELKSFIGYELFAISKIQRNSPAEEVKLSWHAFMVRLYCMYVCIAVFVCTVVNSV
jgi:hypothetical protein